MGLKVKISLFGTWWRPALVHAPLIRSGFEHKSLWQFAIALVLQQAIEERQFKVLAVVSRGLRTKVNVAQKISFSPCPASMEPRTHHQRVVDSRIDSFDGF